MSSRIPVGNDQERNKVSRMASVEERLTKIEKELADLKRVRMKDTQNTNWIFSNNDRLKGDPDLKEIFRLGKELRDNERIEET